MLSLGIFALYLMVAQWPGMSAITAAAVIAAKVRQVLDLAAISFSAAQCPLTPSVHSLIRLMDIFISASLSGDLPFFQWHNFTWNYDLKVTFLKLI